MKLIKNGSKVIGLLFANDTVKSYKVSGGYLSGLDLDANDDVDLSVGDYITSTLESNSQYDNFGDLRVTDVSDVEISDILKLMSLSKKDLIERIEILKHAYLSDLEDQLDTDELFFAVQDKVLEDLTSLDDVITNTIEVTSEMVINYASVIFEAVYNNVVNEIVTEADVLVPDKINNRPVEQYGTNLRSTLETVVHHDNADSLVIHFMNEYEEELDTLLIPITTYDNAVTFINFWNNQKKTTPKLELENMRVISVVFGMYITVEVPEEHEWELQSLTKECRHSDELNKWL